MYERIKNRVRELLASGEIEGFLALKAEGTHQMPYLFTNPDALDQLVIGDGSEAGDTRYPLFKIMLMLLKESPKARLGVLARGCDERALKALIAWNQVEADRVVLLGVACPETLAEKCKCVRPHPDEFIEGEAVPAVRPAASAMETSDRSMRLAYWMEQFRKCVKCYGCRNICPVCFCEVCTLEADDVVPTGVIPPEFPMFHLVRAVHMIGRCADCGLCEETCPASIPLRSLYKKINDIIDAHYQFRPGTDVKERSPLHKAAEPPPAH